MEKARGNTSGSPPPDPFDSFTPRSEDGHASPAPSSQYSSCGESDFERYCSANSMMGTPSMCSSVGVFTDCVESEFGSRRSSFGFGDDNGLENFSLGLNQKLSSLEKYGFGDQRIGVYRERFADIDGIGMPCETNSEVLWENMESLDAQVGGKGGSVKGNLMSSGSGDISQPGAEGGSTSLLVGEEHRGLGSVLEMQLGVVEEDGNSSRYEHSEGDDSMYGSDDERRDRLYYPRNLPYQHEAKANDENPLLINSSVAFGSGDWDDFALETGSGSVTSLTLNKFQEQEKQNLKTSRNSLNPTSTALFKIAGIGQTEGGNDQTNVPIASNQVQSPHEMEENVTGTVTPIGFPISGKPEQVGEARDIGIVNYQAQGADELAGGTNGSSISDVGVPKLDELESDVTDISVSSNQVQGDDDMTYLKNCSVGDVFKMSLDQLVEDPFPTSLNSLSSSLDRKNLSTDTKEVIVVHDGQVLTDQDTGKFKVQLDPSADDVVNQLCSRSIESPRKLKANYTDEYEQNPAPRTCENMVRNTWQNFPAPADLSEAHLAPVKTENVERNEFYDEVVHDMEEILLDSSESPGPRFTQGNRLLQRQLFQPLRDGGPTASTSGTDGSYPLILQPLRIDGVEVVGAKQKKGDVSLSERLVGVKEYTVYIIRVWSGEDQWQVERRYRDFFTLYRRLKTLFADLGWILPSPWFSVEGESRKIFGNVSPNVVSERSILIQECLRSLLHSRLFSSPPSALIWFLSPQHSHPSSPASSALVSQSLFLKNGADTENISTLGKTISLIVEIQPHKSMKQLLERQYYTCAGCHKHFNDGITLMRDIVQTFGWGKPRLCEYTGQLFCSLCHTNDTAILPARVLHHWDFSRYAVSQLAKSYLDSIHDQPMLCVSAVNPFLFSKVPALHHVMGIRKKIGNLLPYIRCPFRRLLNKGLGFRRYLLESNDFFALRDLIDLSKGAFAALPVMMETVSRKILEHITDQCLICCDVGVACGARQACDDPSSLIFPFQEDEVERCPSCKSVFHKPCFRKLTNCPCGAPLRVDDAVGSSKRSRASLGGEASGALDLLGRRSGSGLPMGFLSGLFSRTKQERLERKDSDTVILMGSLPSNAL